MTGTKRVRLSDETFRNGEQNNQQQIAKAEFQIQTQDTIGLPSGIGAISVIAACNQERSRTEQTKSSSMDDSLVQGVQAQIVVATDTGYIALIHNDGTRTVLENSGNPAIQRLLAIQHDTSAQGPCLIPDVVAGDSDGRVTVFTMGRMISRLTVSAPVSALALDSNPNTPRSFIVGDMGGTVTESHAQGIVWRTQLSPAASKVSSAAGLGITSVCSVRFADDHGFPTSYVLAANEGNHVQLLARGHPVLTVPISARCNCMCSGKFIIRNRQCSDILQSKVTQALLGDESGRLYVLDNFKLEPYAQLDFPVTSIVAIPLRALVNYDGPNVVVCATRSNMIYVLYAKNIIGTFAADFWPSTIDVIVPNSWEMRPTIVIAENKCVGNQNVCVLHKVTVDIKIAAEQA
ncbi:hypothetical protein J3B02_002019 [Coemansia erecta]|uniref:Uncharacterized protein n=1 Tax=Coemansia asiatica TaxID=1052880 RepID=A0A9W8CIF7_9FUNG|nr:hypothetical protein LPJ64_003157 [Coemansia asiatica]KAJ2855717.1 hypothetical protein J3B02_002019 [Coemansia erecta]KAJ2879275.1 hypothetical protein FB639_003128 [Coemansia asiatica]